MISTNCRPRTRCPNTRHRGGRRPRPSIIGALAKQCAPAAVARRHGVSRRWTSIAVTACGGSTAAAGDVVQATAETETAATDIAATNVGESRKSPFMSRSLRSCPVHVRVRCATKRPNSRQRSEADADHRAVPPPPPPLTMLGRATACWRAPWHIIGAPRPARGRPRGSMACGAAWCPRHRACLARCRSGLPASRWRRRRRPSSSHRSCTEAGTRVVCLLSSARPDPA